MSFNVYFEKNGGLWTEYIEDTQTVTFNFIEVEDKEEYLAKVGLIALVLAEKVAVP